MSETLFSKIINREIPADIVYEDDKPGEALITLCEDTLANEILGWLPTKDINNYITSYINEKEHNIHTGN